MNESRVSRSGRRRIEKAIFPLDSEREGDRLSRDTGGTAGRSQREAFNQAVKLAEG